jgi:hypothetical protein
VSTRGRNPISRPYVQPLVWSQAQARRPPCSPARPGASNTPSTFPRDPSYLKPQDTKHTISPGKAGPSPFNRPWVFAPQRSPLLFLFYILWLSAAVHAYIPATPTNDTQSAIQSGLNVTDVSMLSLLWYENGCVLSFPPVVVILNLKHILIVQRDQSVQHQCRL